MNCTKTSAWQTPILDGQPRKITGFRRKAWISKCWSMHDLRHTALLQRVLIHRNEWEYLALVFLPLLLAASSCTDPCLLTTAAISVTPSPTVRSENSIVDTEHARWGPRIPSFQGKVRVCHFGVRLDLVSQPPVWKMGMLVLGKEEGSSLLFLVSLIPTFFGNFADACHGLHFIPWSSYIHSTGDHRRNVYKGLSHQQCWLHI